MLCRRYEWGGCTVMDPITLIVTALAAGAALGVTDTASSAVKDGYAALRALIRKRLGGGADAGLLLTRYEEAPATWRSPLAAELAETGADRDADLMAAAQALMRLVDETGARAGKYTVNVLGAQGVQIGDHNRQDNVFNAPPSGLGHGTRASADLGQPCTGVESGAVASRRSSSSASVPVDDLARRSCYVARPTRVGPYRSCRPGNHCRDGKRMINARQDGGGPGAATSIRRHIPVFLADHDRE